MVKIRTMKKLREVIKPDSVPEEVIKRLMGRDEEMEVFPKEAIIKLKKEQ